MAVKRVIILTPVSIEYPFLWTKDELVSHLKDWIHEYESDKYLKQAGRGVQGTEE